MKHRDGTRLFTATLVIAASLLLAACSRQADTGAAASDIIARVGDQPISFSDLNTMMNSSAIVGLSVPALGTPERDQVRLTLLDKMISANLLYLDAVRQGITEDPAYQADVARFEDAVLATLYRDRELRDRIGVSDDEIQTFFQNNVATGKTELTDDVRTAIEATLRDRKVKAESIAWREELRQGAEITIATDELDPADDPLRGDEDILATIDGEPVYWRDARAFLSLPLNSRSIGDRSQALERWIDTRLMVKKARAAGLEQDPVFQARMAEYRKTRAINLHRAALLRDMAPTDEEVEAWFAENRDRIVVPERRKVQMVVVKTREEAEAIKKRIEAGDITMHQAAAEYSIVPGARQNLGEIGWVTAGSGFDELDDVTFLIGPDEIGGPVQSPAGWHLVKVLDMRDPVYDDIHDPETRRIARRTMLRDQLNAYVVDLRKNRFPVEVYQDTLVALAQQEADWYAEVSKTKEKPREEVIEEIEKLRTGSP